MHILTVCSDGAEAKLAPNISGPASGLELSWKETGGVGREKKLEDLRRGKYQDEELQRREKKYCR